MMDVLTTMLFFTHILCTGSIGHVSFLDLFEPIAGATDPITWHFCGKLSR